jgi:hypothetical protein
MKTSAPIPSPVMSLVDDEFYKPIKIERYEFGDDNETFHAYRAKDLIKISSSLEASMKPEDYPVPYHDNQRLIVACGLGVDTFGMLVAMKRRGVRPDLIHWADTGSEHLHTLLSFNYLQAWCKTNDFPPIVIVRRLAPRAGHRGLIEQVWNLKTLPSPSYFRNHSCSISWKLVPQRKYDAMLPWLWSTDVTPKNAIGFDSDEVDNGNRRHFKSAKEAVGFDAEEFTDRKSGSKNGSYVASDPSDKEGNAKYETWFPLAEYEINRQGCVELIRDEGLPVPGKSSCTMCPIKEKCEVDRDKSLGGTRIYAAIEERNQANDPNTKAKLFIKGKGKSAEEFAAMDDDGKEKVGLYPDPMEELPIHDAGRKTYTPPKNSLVALGRVKFDQMKARKASEKIMKMLANIRDFSTAS